MIKLTFIRPEDYWLFAVSTFGIIFTAFALYAGVLQLRLLSALVGLTILMFTAYVIRRGYSKHYANKHLLICFGLSIALAFGLYLLTN